jgi:hypothetical protein
MRAWRNADAGPRSWLGPGRRIMYRREDLDAWADRRIVTQPRGGRP